MTKKTITISICVLVIFVIYLTDALAFYEGSSLEHITQITARDNGVYVVFLSGIPDQGCTYSDRAGLSPNLTGYKNILSSIQLSIAAKWRVYIFVDGCINHTESSDNPEYTTTETIPRIVHIVVHPE